MTFWLPPPSLHVVPAEPRDAAEIARLHARGFYRGWSVEEFSSYILDRTRTPVFVAVDGKRRIGGFAMLRHLGDEAELITIAVEERWRRKGIGGLLMRALFAELHTSPARRLFLEVAADNAAALKLYSRFGFQQVGERKGYYPRPDGTPATALVMARDLE